MKTSRNFELPSDKEAIVRSAARLERQRVATELERLPWVRRAEVRLREEGHVFFGDALIVPRDTSRLFDDLVDAHDLILGLDWRLHDIVLQPVYALPDQDQEIAERPGEQARAATR